MDVVQLVLYMQVAGVGAWILQALLQVYDRHFRGLVVVLQRRFIAASAVFEMDPFRVKHRRDRVPLHAVAAIASTVTMV